jgi:hypothetical protein
MDHNLTPHSPALPPLLTSRRSGDLRAFSTLRSTSRGKLSTSSPFSIRAVCEILEGQCRSDFTQGMHYRLAFSEFHQLPVFRDAPLLCPTTCLVSRVLVIQSVISVKSVDSSVASPADSSSASSSSSQTCTHLVWTETHPLAVGNRNG